MEPLAVLGTIGTKYKRLVYVSIAATYVNIINNYLSSKRQHILAFHFMNLACKVGYFGLKCDTKCVYPSYGNDCQSKCNCKYTYCDHVEGCANLTGANICKGYFFLILHLMQLNIYVQKPACSYLIKINDNNDETIYLFRP